MSFKWRQLSVGFTFAAALCVSAAAAFGANNFTLTGASSSESELVHVTDGNLSVDGYAGIYTGTLYGQGITMFCVDPNHEQTAGTGYDAQVGLATAAPTTTLTNGYYDGGLGSEINKNDATPSEKATATTLPTLTTIQKESQSQIAYLADTYLDPTSSTFSSIDSSLKITNLTSADEIAVNEAAVNLAIWDIVENGPDVPGKVLNIESADFYGNALTSDYIALTDDFLSLASAEVDYSSSTAYWIQAPNQTSSTHGQNYIYKVAVPEASPAAIVSLGFGGLLLILGLRRRRTLQEA